MSESDPQNLALVFYTFKAFCRTIFSSGRPSAAAELARYAS